MFERILYKGLESNNIRLAIQKAAVKLFGKNKYSVPVMSILTLPIFLI